jgi:uncharacterized membrane protein
LYFALLIVLQNLSKVIHIRLWWLILTLAFGLTYIFIVPPFQSPDEPNHFLRIYHISEGRLWGEVSADKHQLGGYIPDSIFMVYTPYEYMFFKEEKKISVESITSNLFKQLPSTATSFQQFPNTARYAFTTYLPQVTAFYLLKKISCPPLLLMYAGRLAAFLCWVMLVYYAINLTPIYKEILMLLSFLPASLAINTTLSADVVTNALAFVALAYFLKFKFQASDLNRGELSLFCGIMLLISWQKIVYFPLLFLLLLVPTSKFGGLKKKVLVLSFAIISNLIVIFWWSGEINKLVYPTGDKFFTTYESLRLDVQINPTLQVEHILIDPVKFMRIFFEASIKAYDINFTTYLTSFGWEVIRVPSGLIYVFKLFLFAFIFIQENRFKIWEKILLLLLGHGLVMLFLLSQHLHWDGVGDLFLNVYGGKYYIPIYPIFFLAFTGLLNKSIFKEKYQRHIYIFFAFTTLIVQIDFLILILQRYYF